VLRFLFWNLNGEPLAEPLRQLCNDYDIDVLVLAECRMEDVELLPALNQMAERTFIRPFNLSSRLSFYTRLPDQDLVSLSDTKYCAVRAVTPPIGEEVILAAVHAPSKLHASSEDQGYLMQRIANQVRGAEEQRGHTRTVLVGDLNMNPFESGVCAADGLHAVMCKQIASRGERQVYGESRSFFYNPMWSYLGDETPGPPGTYFYPNGMIAYFWNTFDQVLYRPSLLESYRLSDVKVISEIDNDSLLSDIGISKQFSDHLPVFFAVRT